MPTITIPSAAHFPGRSRSYSFDTVRLNKAQKAGTRRHSLDQLAALPLWRAPSAQLQSTQLQTPQSRNWLAGAAKSIREGSAGLWMSFRAHLHKVSTGVRFAFAWVAQLWRAKTDPAAPKIIAQTGAASIKNIAESLDARATSDCKAAPRWPTVAQGFVLDFPRQSEYSLWPFDSAHAQATSIDLKKTFDARFSNEHMANTINQLQQFCYNDPLLTFHASALLHQRSFGVALAQLTQEPALIWHDRRVAVTGASESALDYRLQQMDSPMQGFGRLEATCTLRQSQSLLLLVEQEDGSREQLQDMVSGALEMQLRVSFSRDLRRGNAVHTSAVQLSLRGHLQNEPFFTTTQHMFAAT